MRVGAAEDGCQDVVGVGAKLVEGTVAVDPLVEVDLDDGVAAVAPVQVDEQPDLDAVPVGQDEAVEGGASQGALTGQRLGQGGEVGEEAAEERPSQQLGDPWRWTASTSSTRPPARPAPLPRPLLRSHDVPLSSAR